MQPYYKYYVIAAIFGIIEIVLISVLISYGGDVAEKTFIGWSIVIIIIGNTIGPEYLVKAKDIKFKKELEVEKAFDVLAGK